MEHFYLHHFIVWMQLVVKWLEIPSVTIYVYLKYLPTKEISTMNILYLVMRLKYLLFWKGSIWSFTMKRIKCDAALCLRTHDTIHIVLCTRMFDLCKTKPCQISVWHTKCSYCILTLTSVLENGIGHMRIIEVLKCLLCLLEMGSHVQYCSYVCVRI